MNKTALASLVALGTLAASSSAAAQCPPGSWLCADVTIGTGPPPVIVQPAPPPVYVVPPPPRVYFTPAPPPVMYYQPAPVYMVSGPRQYYRRPPAPPRQRWFGIQGQLSGAFLGTPSGIRGLGGMGAGFRLRGMRLGGELALNVISGRDYNDDDRTEVPLSLTGLVYFNPQSRFQVYGLFGGGLSFANVRYRSANRAFHGGRDDGNYTYLGGTLGLGAEFRVSPRFAIFGDLRGFVRGRVDKDRNTNPEFTRTTASGAREFTNGSTGVVGQAGVVLYF